ncbi:hypothetical protein RUND412_001981 [Rhizina undulata]
MSTTFETAAPGTPINSSPTSSGPFSGGATNSANPKRTLFGRKKKSSTNTNASTSTGTLTSGNSSLKGGESVESLVQVGGATSGGTTPKKSPVAAVFMRRNKNDSSGALDNNGDVEAEKCRRGRNSDDDNSSIMTYDSDSDPMPDPQSDPLSATSPSHHSPGHLQNSATFSPLSSTSAVNTNNARGKNSSSSTNGAIIGKKSSSDLLKGAFTRRSTSPIAPQDNASSGKQGGAPGNLSTIGGPDTAHVRPSTASGALDSRQSQEGSRRTGRSSVETSDASDVPPVPTIRTNNSTAGKSSNKAWPAGIVTKEFAQPPSTPQNSSTAPSDDGTPQTTVTPPTPTDSAGHFSSKSPVGAVMSNNGVARRSRSGSLGTSGNTPSKLSQSMTMPIASSTEGGGAPLEGAANSNWNGQGAGSFFQTMFSAAQTAATTLSTSIANTNLMNSPGSRSRSGTGDSKPEPEKENGGAVTTSGVEEKKEPPKRLAVETLGHGELSLGSLGILPSPIKTPTTPTPAEPRGARSRSGSLKGRSANGDVGHQLKSARSDGSLRDRYEKQALSATSGYETAGDGLGSIEGHRPPKTPVAEDAAFATSPAGKAGSIRGDVTPDRTSFDRDEEDGERKRSGSLQSGEKGRRKRGTSGASTGNQIPVQKPTGFAVASKKRNRDFHSLFRSVPEDDYLIEDYGCALQKEILLQGRLYVSEGHICFNSNIFGWINTLVISFDEVVSVEKKSTAMVFPNAIVIQTLHARHVFASFISRDSTFELIVSIWKIGHPQLVDGGGIARLENAGEGSAEVNGEVGSEYEEEDEEEEYEDESDADLGESYTDAGDVSFGDDGGKDEAPVSKTPSRKPSQALAAATPGGGDGKEGAGAAGVDFPGPATHPATTCGDESEHYDKSLCDEVIQAPVGKVYSILFGANSYPFLSKFLGDEEKVLEIAIPDNGEWADTNGKKTRSYSYIKPLNNGIGPKQTRCNITESIDVNDMEDHVTVVMTIQTPDVPSGNVFAVKTRYCLMWAQDGATRMIVNCTIEWSGKSWLKGPIEKGANDGQVAFNKNLLAALRREVQPKEIKQAGAKGKKGKRKKDRDAKGELTGKAAGGAQKAHDSGSAGTADLESWGIFPPLKTYLGPIVDILQPLFQGNIAVILICVLLVVIVINQTRGGNSSAKDVQYRTVPVGRAHWEDLWRNEEDSLWEWLEDRAGLYTIGEVSRGRRMKSYERAIERMPLTEGMKEREVEEAIGVMEERLAVLRKIVEDRKYNSGKEATEEVPEKLEL